jgi:SPP1 gp7 family putative phage head morphogenesis protein
MATIRIDEILQHELQIHRLATGAVNTIVLPSLTETYKAIRAILIERGIPATPKQLASIEKAIAKAVRDNAPWDAVTAELEKFGIYEASVAASIASAAYESTLAAPANRAVIGYINESLMSLDGGRTVTGTWADFVAASTDSNIAAVNNVVRIGYARGLTYSETAKDLRQTFEGMLSRDAEALARTGYSHYATGAREAFADDMSIAIEAVFIATFDNRTTTGCRNLHGTRWLKGDPAIVRTPRHFRCRSTLVYVPKGTELSGNRPAIGGKSGEDVNKALDKRRNPPKYRGKKDQDIFDVSQVQPGTTQDAWLREQPRWFVDQTLGKTRADLFIKGDMPLSKFTDMTGRQLTLDELRANDARVFQSLGL